MTFLTNDTFWSADEVRTNSPTLNTTDTAYIAPADGTDRAAWWKIENPIAGNVIGILPDVSTVHSSITIGTVQSTISFAGADLYQARFIKASSFPGVSSADQVVLQKIGYASLEDDEILDEKYPDDVANAPWEKLVIPQGNSGNGWMNEFYLRVAGESLSIDQAYGQNGIAIPNEGRFLVTTGMISGARNEAWGNWQDVINTDGLGGVGVDGTFPSEPVDQIDFALSGVDPLLVPETTVVPSDTNHPQRDAIASWWNDGGENDFINGRDFSLIDTFTQNRPQLNQLYNTAKSLFVDNDFPDFVYNNQSDDKIRNLTTDFERSVRDPLGNVIKDALTNSLDVKSRLENFKGIKNSMKEYLNGLIGEIENRFKNFDSNSASLASSIMQENLVGNAEMSPYDSYVGTTKYYDTYLSMDFHKTE